MLDSFYSNFEPGTIRINHIFKVGMIDDTALEMQCSAHDGSSVVRQSMIKRGATLGQEQLDLLKSYPLETLKSPGLHAIKQVELYKKWRQYADPQYWEEICPEPSDEVMEQVKNDKSVKRMETTKRAKSSVSEKRQEQARKKPEKVEERETKKIEAERKKGEKEQRVAQKKASKDEKDKKKAETAQAAAKKKDAAFQKRLTRDNQKAEQEATKTKNRATREANTCKSPNNSANDGTAKKEEFKQLLKYFFNFQWQKVMACIQNPSSSKAVIFVITVAVS
jgi:hypothetical protein